MMYYANFNRNNGCHLCYDLSCTNKRKLIARISSAARRGVFAGNEYKWLVWDSNDIIVAAGGGYKPLYGGIIYYNYQDLIGQPI